MKRGAIKAYREYLNRAYPGVGHGTHSYNGQCANKTRPYGDYLYAQDRSMFLNNLADWSVDPDFNREAWI